jgi:rare lipoprotein A (peptidoglycan hydrolase)
VHREYPTAAYNHVPKGTKLLVTNTKTQKTCVVEVTDRNGMGKYHIDLSHMAFGSLADHSIGTIKVFVKIL